MVEVLSDTVYVYINIKYFFHFSHFHLREKVMIDFLKIISVFRFLVFYFKDCYHFIIKINLHI